MKFKFLGTAAAEAIPALWCNCDTCKQAWANGGKDIRRRASYLIDDDTLIDFGPDAHWQTHAFDVNLTKIKRIFFTHPHADHLDPVELFWRSPGFGNLETTLDVYGMNRIACRIMDELSGTGHGYSLEDLKIKFHSLWHGAEFETDDGISATAIDARHAEGLGALFYAIRRGGKSVLVANDTGYPLEHSWEIIEKMKFDLVTVDSTMGFSNTRYNGHMNVDTVVEFAERLKEKGCLNPGARVFATHFSHNGGNLQSRLEEYFTPHGIGVAYDGLEIDL